MSDKAIPNRAAPNRRGFLKALGGAAAFAGFGQAFGQPVQNPKQLQLQTPEELLGLAATAEAISVTLYHHVLTEATFGIHDDALEQLRFVVQAEQNHLQLLSGLGGKTLADTFNLPSDLASDAHCFVQTALELERVCTGAYIAASYQFAQLGKPELAATAAQLGASEAQHLALLSQIAGYGPREVSLPEIPFKQLSDAPPVLAQFLGRRQQTQVQVKLPTAAAIEALAGAGNSGPVAFVEAYASSKRLG